MKKIMKKLLLLLLVSTSLIMTSCSKDEDPPEPKTPNCVNSEVFYNRIDVMNGWGNVVDFVLTYDNCQPCDNNFTIQNNANANVYYNFSIRQSGIVVYQGYFNLPPFGSVFFNDAFYNCNSTQHFTEVLIW